jgi:hypothetical protein
VAIVSGETMGNTLGSLAAVEAGATAKFPDEDGKSELFMTDDGPSIVPGIKAHLKAIGSEQKRGSCSIHFTQDVVPKQKARFIKKANYDLFFKDLGRIQLSRSHGLP